MTALNLRINSSFQLRLQGPFGSFSQQQQNHTRKIIVHLFQALGHCCILLGFLLGLLKDILANFGLVRSPGRSSQYNVDTRMTTHHRRNRIQVCESHRRLSCLRRLDLQLVKVKKSHGSSWLHSRATNAGAQPFMRNLNASPCT